MGIKEIAKIIWQGEYDREYSKGKILVEVKWEGLPDWSQNYYLEVARQIHEAFLAMGEGGVLTEDTYHEYRLDFMKRKFENRGNNKWKFFIQPVLKAQAALCELNKQAERLDRPKIICLCGSTRFKDAFTEAQLRETLAGKIVLTIGCNMRSDTEIFGHLSDTEFNNVKVKLDELHKRKIDLADEVLILNVGGYIGDSTKSELDYATKLGKPIKYLEEVDGQD